MSQRFGPILVFFVLCIAADCSAAGPASKAGKGARETPPLTTPEQALADITIPSGFRVSLFASEPVIRQPIGLATDSRGRLWVAENNTYSDARTNFDLSK
ncbi:MAG TPA: hypothetical protein VFG04_26445, partial [Planctomycetaceae bacterium]|nr:hypothetical protein [Planctomycetaceae bacterium]